MNLKFKDLIITDKQTILDALKQMDRIGRKLLIIVNSDFKYLTLLSIGDIQRAIIANCRMDDSVFKYISQVERLVASDGDSLDSIKDKMKLIRADFMPVISKQGEVIKVYYWEELFGIEKVNKSNLDLPVVIMAGGKGTRLAPLTNVLPKPLIPVGEKTIIEEIMDRFVTVGCRSFYLSINYKADMIKYYLSSIINSPYMIEYFQEDKPLGTAGSMFLIKNKIKSTFFVSNCDIIIDQDYSEIIKYHRENKNEITVVAALKHYPIPYGTIETGNNGQLLELTEKPELTFKINSGMYVIEAHVLNEIPGDKFFHITELIANVMTRGGTVGVFPVSEKSWKDIGDWKDYIKNVAYLKK